MQRRGDQGRIAGDEVAAGVDSEVEDAELAEVVDSAEVEVGVVILTQW